MKSGVKTIITIVILLIVAVTVASLVLQETQESGTIEIEIGSERIVLKPGETLEDLEDFYLEEIEEPEGYVFAGFYDNPDRSGNPITEITVKRSQVTYYEKFEPISYSISYDLDGGSLDSPNPDTYTITTDTFALDSPEKEGYAFAGWYNNSDFEGNAITEITKGTFGDLQLLAKWDINTYTVTFDANGGELQSGDLIQTINHGNNAIAPSLSREGYQFIEWSENFDNITQNKTIKAIWTLIESNILFDAQGGDAVASIDVTYDAEYGQLPATQKTGYIFEGWFTAAEGGAEITSATTVDTVSDITLYAQWTAKIFDVDFDTRGGDAITDIIEVTYDNVYGELPQAERTGYSFDGWFTATEGGDEVTSATIVAIANNHTLFAQWTINEYTISFESNGGSIVDEITQDYGTTVIKSETIKTGYTFEGWFTDDGVFENLYTFDTVPAENIELFAKWTINSYTITFESNGGSIVDEITQDYGTTVIEPETIKTGYTFEGWYTDNNTFNSIYTFSTMPAEDFTLFANWEMEVYTVIFDLDGGSKDSGDFVQEIEYGSPATAPIGVTRDGYNFGGWDKDFSEITEDITITAQWISNINDLELLSNNGIGDVITLTAGTGETIVLPENQFTKTGYEFIGWSKTLSGDAIYKDKDEYIMGPDSAYTLFAQWEEIVYGSISRDPANTGGNLNVVIEADTITFDGEIEWYEADEELGRVAGSRVGVEIKAPEGIDLDIVEVVIGDTTYTTLFNAEKDYFWWYPLVTEAGQEFTATISWNAVSEQTFTVKIDENSILLPKTEITFDKNSENATGDMPNQIIEMNETLLNTNQFENLGYSFIGWALTEDGEIVYGDEEEYQKDSQSAITLYAQWTANTYTITYDSNKPASASATVEGLTDDSIHTYDVESSLTTNEYSLIGWIFQGWATEVDGAIEYNDGDSVSNLTDEQDAIVTLYAKWTANTYTITYDSNQPVEASGNITGTTEDSIHTYDTESALTTNGYSLTGWTLVGWTTEAGGAIEYNDGDSVSNLTTELGDIITLYAEWTANEYTLTLVSEFMTQESFVVYDSVYGNVLSSTMNITGYTFEGWFTQPDGAGYKIESSDTVTTDSDHTLYAYWTASSYSITFDANYNGENIDTLELVINEKGVTFDEVVGILPQPTLFAYTFVGWNTQSDAEGTTYTKTTVYQVADDLTLFAIWDYTPYENTLEISAEDVIYGQTLDISEVTNVSGGALTYEYKAQYTGDESYTSDEPTDAGLYTVRVTSAATYSYQSASAVAYFEITAAELTVTYVSESVVYGTAPAFEITIAGWQYEEGQEDLTTVPSVSTTQTNVGTYDLTPEGGAADNYTFNYVAGTLEITPAKLTVTYVSESVVYKTEEPAFEITITGWQYEEGQEVLTTEPSVSTTETNVGTYDLTPEGGAADNYTFTYVAGTLEITQATKDMSNVEWDYIDAFTYDETEKTVLVIELPQGVQPVYENNAKTDAGDYIASVTFDYDDHNFVLSQTIDNLNWQILKAENTLVISAQDIIYGQALDISEVTNVSGGALTYEYKVQGAGDETYGTDEPTELGIYTVRATSAETNNYNQASATADFEILSNRIEATAGNNGAITPQSQDVLYGTNKTFTITPDINYTISEILVNGVSITITAEEGQAQEYTFENVTEGQTISATFEAIVFDITYELDGGTNHESNPDTYTVEDEITFADPTKDGYGFDGWFDQATGGEQIDTLTSGDITIYAQWTANTYTVTYDSNKPASASATVEGLTDDSIHTYDVESSLTTNEYSLIGWIFQGWATEVDGAIEYNDGDSVSNLTDEQDAIVTLYAKWTANTYTITYDSNQPVEASGNITGTTEDSIHTYDTESALTTNGYSLTGWTLVGWTTEAGGAIEYNDGDSVSNLTTELGDIITLYAEWTANEYTLTLDSGFMTQQYPVTYDSVYGNIISSGNITGYTFEGWFTQPDGAGYKIESSDTVTTDSDHTLYAYWTASSYSITFDANYNGENIDTLELVINEKGVTFDEVVGILPQPTLFAYTFVGWNTQSDAEGTTYTKTTVYQVADDLTLFAIWDYTPYENTLEISAEDVIYGQTLDISEVTNVSGGALTYEYKAQYTGDESYTSDEPTDAGLYTVRVTSAATYSYQSASAVAYFEITAAELTVTYVSESVVYGTAPAFEITIAGWQYEEGQEDLTTVPSVSTTQTNVGTYDLTPEGGAADNYTFNYVAGTLEITPAKLTVTYVSESVVYKTEEPAFEITITGWQYEEGQEVLTTEPSVSTTETNVGTYDLTPEGGAADNYTFTYVAGTLEITQATKDMSNVEWDYIDAFTYDETEKTVLVTGLPDGVTVNVYTDNTAINAGDYIASVTLDYDDLNFVLSQTIDNLNWQILKAENTLKISAQDIIYGQALDISEVTNISGGALTYEYKVQGDGDETYVIDEPTEAGLYTVKATSAETNNYNQASATADFEILSNWIEATAGNNGAITPQSQDAPYGTNKTFTITPDINYTISEILVNGVSITITAEEGQAQEYTFENVTEGQTISATFEAIVFDITYELDGGTNHESNPDTYTVEDEITFADPTKDGYGFDGWFDQATGGEQITLTSGDITIYAQWTANTYTVTYDSNKPASASATVEGLTDDSIHTYDVESSLTTNGYSLTGWTFVGWATEVGGVIEYNDGDSVSNLTTEQAAIITLYAQWTANTYTITYNSNKPIEASGNITGATEDSIHTYDTESALTTNGYSLIGWTFEGWAVIAGNDIEYNDGDSVNNLTAESSGTIILYAEWTANEYTLTLDSGFMTQQYPVTYDSVYGNIISSGNITGYTFEGWFTQPDGAGYKIESSDTVTTDSDHTLYAYWTASSYSITFDANYNGENIDTLELDINEKEVTFDEVVGTLPQPTLFAYTFVGWNTQSDAEGTTYTEATVYKVADDLTLFAIWEYTPCENTLEISAEDVIYGQTLDISEVTNVSGGALTYEYKAQYTGDESYTSDEPTDAGLYTVRVTSAATYSYQSASAVAYFEITPAELTVTYVSESVVYGTAPAFEITIAGWQYEEGQEVLTTVPSVSTTETNVDSYDLTPEGGVADNYTFTYVLGTLEITAAELTVTYVSESVVYGTEPAFEITITGWQYEEGEEVLNTVPSVSTTETNVDSYDLTPEGGVADNYTFTYVLGTLEITQAELTVTYVSESVVYGTAPAFEITIAGWQYEEGEEDLNTVPSVSTTETNVGTYDLTPEGGAADNYTFNYVAGTLEITPAELTVTYVSESVVYGTAPAFEITIAGWQYEEGQEVLTTVPSVSTTETNVDSYDLTPEGGAADNYTFNYVAGTLEITPAELTVTYVSESVVYGTAPAFEITIAGWQYEEGEEDLNTVPSVSTTETNVGTYDLTPEGGAADNYTFTYVAGTLEITPAELTVTYVSESVVYKTEEPAFEITITGWQYEEGQEVLNTVPSVSTTETNVGTYDLTPEGGAADNYTFNYVAGTLEITPAELTVTYVSESVVYGTEPAFEITITGWIDGEEDLTTEPSVSTIQTDVGSYQLTPQDGETDNYTFTYVAGTLEITPAELTVTYVSESVVYKTEEPAFEITITGWQYEEGQEVLNTVPSVSTTETNVGTYDLTPEGGAADNYTFNYVAGTLEITPAELTVTYVSESVVYKTEEPAFEITITGWQYEEGQEVLTTEPSVSTTETNVGTYDLTPEGGAADNYTFTYVAGTLEITQATKDMSNVEWDYIDAFTYDETEKTVLVIELPQGVQPVYENNAKTDAGDYIASVTFDYDDHNFVLSQTIDNLNWQILKAENTLKISAQDIIYGQALDISEVTNISGGALTYEYKVQGDGDETYVIDEPTEAGLYTVKATSAETNNYNQASATADFEILSNWIEATAGNNGAITPQSQDAPYGTNKTFTITPDINYTISEILVNGVSITITAEEGQAQEYTFENVTEGQTISATFEAIVFDITYELDGGTNHESNPDTYTVEDEITFADPERDGYTFDGWYEDEALTTLADTEIVQGSTGDLTFYAKWGE